MSRDLPEELGAAELGLQVLLRSLAGAATPAELAGEEATLAMFRSTRPSAGYANGARRLASPPRLGQAALAGHVPADRPRDMPADSPRDMPADSPRAMPADSPRAMPADRPRDMPAGQPGTVSAGRPGAVSVDRPRHVPAGRPRHRSTRAGHARRASWLVATTLALGGSFAVAGYAAALPAPVQRVAHSLFGFAGVPGTARAGHPAPAPGRGASSVPVTPSRSARPSPQPTSPPSPPDLSATVASAQLPAGGKVTVTVLLTLHGRALPGAAVRLLELAAGQPAWQVAAHATTSAGGQAVLVVPSLTIDATFRVTGPDGSASGRLTVVVIPLVSVSVTSQGGHWPASVLTASCPLAQRGDLVELQVLSGGQWRDVRDVRGGHRIGTNGLAAFTVPVGKNSMTLRVVLAATAYHGQSVSRTVTVPGRQHRHSQQALPPTP